MSINSTTYAFIRNYYFIKYKLKMIISKFPPFFPLYMIQNGLKWAYLPDFYHPLIVHKTPIIAGFEGLFAKSKKYTIK